MTRPVVNYINGDRIFVDNGYEVYSSNGGGGNWVYDGFVPVTSWRRLICFSSLLQRTTRGGISLLLPLPDGTRLAVTAGRIWRADPGSRTYAPVFELSKGSMPLSLCTDADGAVLWGEYHLNLLRSDPIRIYRSEDSGRTWETAFTFSAGSVCHIHKIVHDPYENVLWICTGDRDREVAIFRKDKSFTTMSPLVQGNQEYRTVALIPLPDCLLYGTDNPRGDNFIIGLDRKTGKVRRVQAIPGPVVYGCRVGNMAAFSTMVERQVHEATLWVGNEKKMEKVAHFNAFKGARVMRELAGYPTAVLPDGESEWPNLYFTPRGIRGYGYQTYRLDLSTGTIVKLLSSGGRNMDSRGNNGA